MHTYQLFEDEKAKYRTAYSYTPVPKTIKNVRLGKHELI